MVNPELSDLANRVTEAERLVDQARESVRTLLHHLTDTRLALDAVVRELHDVDDARMAASSSARPALLVAIESGH